MRRTLLLLTVLGAASGPVEAAAESRRVAANAAREAIAALPVPSPAALARPTTTLLVEGVTDVATGERLDLELERFELLAPGAHLVVHDAEGARREPMPHGVYLRGWVRGRDGGRVFLSLHERELRGFVAGDDGIRMLGFTTGEARAAGRLEARRLDPAELAAGREPFRCANSDRAVPLDAALLGAPPRPPAAAGRAPAAFVPEGALYSSTYAVETDFEYFQLFGNAGTAATYALDLMAFLSTIYVGQVDTAIFVGSVTIRSTAADPWTQTSSLCALFEFGRFWNDNLDAVERTAAVMLSGKSTGGGVAWLGVLCDGEFNVNHGGSCGLSPNIDNYGGAYAFVGSIDGDFDVGNPNQVIWDVVATAHEIGHNFNSPHTHCYFEAVGGDDVDRCYVNELSNNPDPDTCVGSGDTARWDNSGCACAGSAATYPGIGTTTGGSQGQGGGVIMSYCHLLAGSFTNVSLNFGLGHTRGFQASRVATRMEAHAAANTACTGFGLFLDGFESGDTSFWDSTSP
jgi:hypothetical protein